MASPSKEDKILEIILENSPLKHWHFEELLKESKISRAALNKWIKRYQKEAFIKRVKEKGKFPYFTCGENNLVYKSRKKQYLLNKLYDCGLICEILRSNNIKTAIIFGSAIKGDWYKDSDIDIFIYGHANNIKRTEYEKKLKRDIELHIFENKEKIKEVKTGLIQNIINGYIIKGNIQDIAEVS